MVFYQNRSLLASQRNNRLKVYLARLLGATLVAGAIGLYVGNQPSDNLTKHLKNPDEICLGMPDYAGRQFIRQYAENIVRHSKKYNVPPELVAAPFLSENSERQKYEDWKDRLATGDTAKIWDSYGARIGKLINNKLGYTNPSLGPGQVQVKTAMHLGKKFGKEQSTREDLEKKLLDPDTNIEYTAMAIADIIQRHRDSGKLLKENIFDNPGIITDIAFEYVGLTKKDPSQDTKEDDRELGFNKKVGYRKLRSNIFFVAETDFRDLLGSDATITNKQQEAIATYIKGYIQKDPLLKNMESGTDKNYDRKTRENQHKMLQC